MEIFFLIRNIIKFYFFSFYKINFRNFLRLVEWPLKNNYREERNMGFFFNKEHY